MNKQITLTIDEYHIAKIKEIADKTFEGNVSMATRAILRKFFTEHS